MPLHSIAIRLIIRQLWSLQSENRGRRSSGRRIERSSRKSSSFTDGQVRNMFHSCVSVIQSTEPRILDLRRISMEELSIRLPNRIERGACSVCIGQALRFPDLHLIPISAQDSLPSILNSPSVSPQIGVTACSREGPVYWTHLISSARLRSPCSVAATALSSSATS